MPMFDGILPDPSILSYLEQFNKYDCSLHCHSGQTCSQYALLFILPNMIKMATKLYLPIHLIPKLIFARKLLRQNPTQFFKQVTKGFLLSTSFLSLMMTALQVFNCNFNRISGRFHPSNSLMAGLLSGSFILIETNERREEMGLFCLPFILEIAFAYLKKRNIYGGLHQNYKLLYGLAISILSYQYSKNEGTIKNSYKKLFDFLWGDI